MFDGVIFYLTEDLHKKVQFYPGSVTNNMSFEKRLFWLLKEVVFF